MSGGRAWLAAALAACGGVEQGYEPMPQPDAALFAATVEPVLEARCANPSCHGRPERPFAIYAPRRWRVDAARTFLDEPLTDDEVAQNFDRACGFVVTAGGPDEALLWRKATGLAYHGGGAVLLADEASARALADWIATAW